MPNKIDFFSIDVSFISLKLLLPVAYKLLGDGAEAVCLIKPQFEAGRENVGKKGVVRDPTVHLEVIRGILDYAASIGFTVMGLDYSPIKGPEGNIEYICHLKNGDCAAAPIDAEAVVKASHEALGRRELP